MLIFLEPNLKLVLSLCSSNLTRQQYLTFLLVAVILQIKTAKRLL